jgi:hypothetical protein
MVILILKRTLQLADDLFNRKEIFLKNFSKEEIEIFEKSRF